MQISKANSSVPKASGFEGGVSKASEGMKGVGEGAEAKEEQDPLQRLSELVDALKAMLDELAKAKEGGEAAPAGAAPAGGSDDMMQKLLEMLMEILGVSEEAGKNPEEELSQILDQNPEFAQDLGGALKDMGASQGLMKSLGLGAGGSMGAARRG